MVTSTQFPGIATHDMKEIHWEVLVDTARFQESETWDRIRGDVGRALDKIRYPSDDPRGLVLHVESGREGRRAKRPSGAQRTAARRRGESLIDHENGVKPIKDAFVASLQRQGWELEARLPITSERSPGPLDAVLSFGEGKLFALEWETGNISSSHRAVNKMALGILKGILSGGLLILPSREMKLYLTDRIGNFPELEPYFELWRSLSLTEGFLAILSIEHDALDPDVPPIPKNFDGLALVSGREFTTNSVSQYQSSARRTSRHPDSQQGSLDSHL